MTIYLLDTNHLAQAVHPRHTLLSRIRTELATGSVVGTCAPVLCELEAGIQQVADPARYRRVLERVLERIRIWPLDRETTIIYGELFSDPRRRGACPLAGRHHGRRDRVSEGCLRADD